MKMIIERQGARHWSSAYRYVRYDQATRLHVFSEDSGKAEFFRKTRNPPSGWHLQRGQYYYEFCHSDH